MHVEFQSSNGCNDVKYQSSNDSYDVGDDFDENRGITLMRKGGEERIKSIGLGGTTSQPAFEGSQPIKVRRDRRMKMTGMMGMMEMRMRRKRRKMKLYFLAWQL